MDFDDLGFGFYAKLAGVFLLGAFLFLAAVALLAGWIFDRHDAKERHDAGAV
jgi:hypothetical protein